MSIHLPRLKSILTLVAILLVVTSVRGQSPTVTTRNLFWGSVVFNYQLNDRWTLVSDALFRFETTDGDLFQSGIRAGVQYKTSQGFQWTAGGCVFLHYPNPNGRVARPEYRGWQEVGKKYEFRMRHTLFPRIRFEQRFFREYSGDVLAEEISFHSYRVRLRVEYSYAITRTSDSGWSLIAGDEIMFHQRENGFSSHDQNRAWAGFAYKINPAFTAQLTYLHIYQQRFSTVFDQFHVLRLTLQFAGKRSQRNDESPK